MRFYDMLFSRDGYRLRLQFDFPQVEIQQQLTFPPFRRRRRKNEGHKAIFCPILFGLSAGKCILHPNKVQKNVVITPINGIFVD